ncbi:hypothetical protein HYH03_017219 [Edaphochlamys debaryana]|uniref:C-type lectin domain-containing protein n=1 Tax=Edaphochlamys debaryana TaxID=47281 RepID=A0A835XID2_9CHLO|nr:hypothetical protein HYH03_017219 [Edaphochlamys debaryana]|eukprot:KAG2483974.1 hypothetical protein HYH03_017219 [Edaphochlamys debaryana]
MFQSTLEEAPWLSVYLDSPSVVSVVRIINRIDCCWDNLKAQVICGLVPSVNPGLLATIQSLEDMDVLRTLAALAEVDAPNVWVGYTDLLSPDEPYWEAGHLDGAAQAGAWLELPDTVNGERAACGFLDATDGKLRRAPCSSRFGMICMSQRADQQVAVAELSGDGLPDIAVLTKCAYDSGASLIGFQQPSPSSLSVVEDLVVRPTLSARTCGDGIPYWGVEECDLGAGFPINTAMKVHKNGFLSPGIPLQYRAYLETARSVSATTPNWGNVETAAMTDPSFTTFTTTCGCTPDNPGGQPVNLSVVQNFGSIEFSWVVGSACESTVSVTRALLDPITEEPGDSLTVAQLGIGLACGTTYRPSKTELDEDIIRDGLQVGRTYRYCVVVASLATDTYFLDANSPLDMLRFVSEPICKDIKIQWAGRITGEVRTRFDTAAPGVRLSARLLGSPYVESIVTDDSGRYTLTLQADVPSCDPILAPERCLSQTVRVTASARTKLRNGRIQPHVFSISDRITSTQTVALQHMETSTSFKLLDESLMPITGGVAWPGTELNYGYDQTRGCPISGAYVCALNARDNSSIACSSTDPDGRFLVAAGIGSVVKLQIKYANHTFKVNLPANLEILNPADSSFEVLAPIYDVDINRQTTIEPGVQYKTYELPALPWEISFVVLTEPIPELDPILVSTYLTITNQLSSFINLTSSGATESGDLVKMVYMAPNDIEVDVCRNYRSLFVVAGDRSYATLESSISTAVKLSMIGTDEYTCGGLGNDEVFRKALPWNLVNAIPFYKYLSKVNAAANPSSYSDGGDITELFQRQPVGRGYAVLDLLKNPDMLSRVQEIFDELNLEADEDTLNFIRAETLRVKSDASLPWEEILAYAVQRYEQIYTGQFDTSDLSPDEVPTADMKAMTILFNRGRADERSRLPSSYAKGSNFAIDPKGFAAGFPACSKSQLTIGFDADFTTCVNLFVGMLCKPAIRDRGTSGIATEKAWYNGEEEESYYKLRISREEGFSTPKESTPELTGSNADMILAPTFAITFNLQDSLEFDASTCQARTILGVPGWNLRDNMHGTAWHSVWHIKNVIVPELERSLAAENAKDPSERNGTILGNITQGLRGWQEIIHIHKSLTDLAAKEEEALPSYKIGEQEINGMVQGSVEGNWHNNLEFSELKNVQAFGGRGIDPARLEESAVWRQGYFEGQEKLQSLVLRTQRFMDNSSNVGNIVVNPLQKAAVGGVVAGKQLDMLSQAYGRQFNTFSFSGGEFSRTPLTLRCYSRCPMAQWPLAWPQTQPIIYNRTDQTAKTNITLTLFNPAFTFQPWSGHSRVSEINIEWTRPTADGGVWSKVRNGTGAMVNFAALEDPAFGFASMSWAVYNFLSEGEYLLRYVVYCDANQGGGMDSYITGSPITMLVDTTSPYPVVNSLTPNMTYLPGDPIWVDFSEPLDCRVPYTFGVVANYKDTSGNYTVPPIFLLGACQDRRITLTWEPLNAAIYLVAGRIFTITIGNAKDLAGNTITRPVNITFTIAATSATAPVSLKLALGPSITRRRQLLAASGDGQDAALLSQDGLLSDGFIMPQELVVEKAFSRGENIEQFLRKLEAKREAKRRKLLATVNSVINECWEAEGGGSVNLMAFAELAKKVLEAKDANGQEPTALLSNLAAKEAALANNASTVMVAATALTSDSVREMTVFDVTAAGEGGVNGLTSATVAAKLAAMARDKDSCLFRRLDAEVGAVRAISAKATLKEQMQGGATAAELAAAVRDGAAQAQQLGLLEAWEAQVAAAQREAMAPVTLVVPEVEQERLAIAGEALAVVADPDSRLLAEEAALAAPAESSAAPLAGRSSWVAAFESFVARHPYGGVLAGIFIFNAAVIGFVMAVWMVRRRSMHRPGGGVFDRRSTASRMGPRRRGPDN